MSLQSPEPSPLKRHLGLLDLTMIVIGSSVGSGIFLTPSDVARELASPVAILAVWLLGGVMTLAGALTYAELGGLFPRAGGVYIYLCEAYGDLVGFLYGWANLFVITTGSIAALAVAFATYLGYFVPLSTWEIKGVAVAGLALVTLVNLRGIGAGARMTNVFTTLKLAGIALVVGVGIFGGPPKTTHFAAIALPPQPARAFAAALVGVLWSYGGWQHATFTAAEAKHPRRDVPRALVLGAAAVTIVYLLMNVAYMFLLDPTHIAASKKLAADAVSLRLGAVGGAVIAATIVLSTFGTAGIYTMTAPRMYYAMAKRGALLPIVGRVDARTSAPRAAVLLQSTWGAVLILFWGTFENLISYVVITEWIFFALAGASVFVFRRRLPEGTSEAPPRRGQDEEAERPARVPWYPLPPLFFVAVSVWFVVNAVASKPLQSLAGIGFLLVGVPVYLLRKRRA